MLDLNEKLFGLSKIWSEVHYNFAYLDQIDFSWDDLFSSFIPKIVHSQNDLEYYRLLIRFVATLQDAHTSVYLPSYLQSQLCSPPIQVKNFEDKYYVINTNKDLEKSLAIGSEIISVDDIPVNEYLTEKVHPYIAASTIHALKSWGAEDLLIGLKDSKVKLGIKKQNGSISDLEIFRQNTDEKQWVFPKSNTDLLTFRRLEEEIGYLQIDSFADWNLIDHFIEIIPVLGTVTGLILDLRNNLGGNSQIAGEMVKFFTSKDQIAIIKSSTRKHLAAQKALGAFIKEFPSSGFVVSKEKQKQYLKSFVGDVWEEENEGFIVNDRMGPKILCPLIILTGPSTASAAEEFLVSMNSVERGILLGQKTCGSTGIPLFFSLPGGGKARICTRKCTFPDGQVFVGKGIQPQVEVIPTIDHFLSSVDIELQKSIEILKSKIGK